MDHPRKVTYRTGLFDPPNLTSPSKINSALLEFSAVINRANYVEVLKDLFEKKYILVLVLSGIQEEISLTEWILDDFPSDPSNFDNSFAYALLCDLCDFFLLYSPSADAETRAFLNRHDHYVRQGTEVLKILLATAFLEEQNSKKSPPPSPTKKRIKREQKHARKLAREPSSIDHKAFVALGFTVPKNRLEADGLCEKVWLRMGAILDVLLNGIRRPEVIDAIHALFIPQERPEEPAAPEQSAIIVGEPMPSPSSPRATEEAPPLYSRTQSMRVTFHFEPPADFGEWSILLASQAQSDLRYWQRRDKKIFLIIMKKLNEISCGFFSNDNQKRLCGPNTAVPVFEAKMTGDLRLVYAVDCVTGHDNQTEIQALRVFGIFTHTQMDYRLWECVSYFYSSRSKEYRKRCLARRQHPAGGNIYLPESFPESTESSQLAPDEFNLSLPADDPNQLHRIISLEKYVKLSKDLLESIESNKDADFPFEVSKYERGIIEHPYSSFVLGRSGTGKTTTMLFRMLLIERAHQLSEEPRQRPRQLFVTKSHALAEKVKKLFMSYLSSLAFASRVDKFVVRRKANVSDEDIFNMDDDDTEWRSDLPEKFSELEDEHFPLFITFKNLCTMIEADIQATDPIRLADPDGVVGSLGTPCLATKKLVTLDRFIAEYWPRFEHNRFHPLLVFNEIMGVIAGSEWSLFSPNGYLDHETYIKLSPRMYPVFAEHRETTYGIFMSYLKRKRELDDYDLADRTHTIIRSMAKELSVLQKVSHLYVDEAQDNLLIDAFLLRLLCGNSDGLFWAGDTAQTISAGSSFRFNDLKAFLYRLQKTRRNQEASAMPMRVKEPRMFYLSTNYRSHAGIVNCAHSVVEIINKYWRSSIDPLPRERGRAHGAMPIFYTDVYPEFIRERHFAARNRSIPGKIELGADQCILVRDEKAREKLRNEMGDEDEFHKLGTVLTLYQSKGLEFNDVLLYNFFHDSLVDNGWRLILNDVPHEGIGQSQIMAPEFDTTRHATLCSELKSLYVAITRARNNLRIVDESFFGEPMRALWESRGQILSCRPGQESTDFAKPSNEAEWADRGKIFFDNCQWELAKDCYAKAGKKHAASVADAYLQREEARRIPSEGKGKARNKAFEAAAKIFESVARNANDVLAKNKYLKLSAGCWEDGNFTCRAAEVYRQGDWLSEASRLYYKLRKFDEIYHIITQSNAALAATIPENIRDATRLHFSAKKPYQKAHRLFDSVEEELIYLENHSLHDAQLDLFVSLGQRRKAADICLSEGRPLKALKLYLQDVNKRESMLKAKEIILNTLWQLSPFGVKPVEQGKMNRLLDRASGIQDVMDDNDNEEMIMFRAILDGRQSKLSELAKSFLKRGNQHAALLCYDHYFDHLPPLTDEVQRVASDLHEFSEYVQTLRRFTFLDDPAGNPRTSRLFGFRAGEEKATIVLLKPNTLHDSPYLGMDSGLKGIVDLTQEDFLAKLRVCLQARLKDRVTTEDEMCCRSPALRSPCPRFVIYGNCWSSPCDRSHVSPDFVWFRHMINAHLLQIVIYHSISGIQYKAQFRSQQRFWLAKLYEVLNPASHHFGPTSNMNTTLAAFPRAVEILIDWVRAVSFGLDFEQDDLLTAAMQTADFAFSCDRNAAETYMSRCKFVTTSCPSEFCRKPPVNSLQEMLMSWSQNDSSNLVMGIRFICHVIERQIPVNIHVFCTFIERMCSLLIVCNFLRRKGNLHDIMLPRTWLKASLDTIDVEGAKRQYSSCFWWLLQPLERLIHVLYFQPTHENSQFKLGLEFNTLGTQPFNIRGLFIARVCRVLGLLGSNIRVDLFQYKILNIFTSLHQEVSHQEHDPKISRLYKGYFTAKTFLEVHQTTRQSMQRAVFDEMVRLLHSERLDRERLKRERRYDLRDIPYSTHGALVSLLDAPEYFAQSRIEHGDDTDEHDDGQELEVDDGTVEEAPESDDLIPDTEIPEGMYTGHSDQDMRAASIIQRYSRRFLDKKWDMMKAGQASSVRRWFVPYSKSLLPDMRPRMTKARPKPRYCVYFLGPLPALQAALDSIRPVLHKTKESLKKKLGSSNNFEDLEEVGLNLTRINKAMKSLQLHQLQLQPESLLHSDCDIDRLKKQVKEVFDTIDNIPLVKMPDELQEALEMVSKAILQESKLPPQIVNLPRPKERRPQLVMECLHELIEDGHEVY